ncbi:hypothetical protein SEA_EMIANNA_46 [Gordonia phage Emianna]|uniref:Uncharacterized protein n=4 Tax=Foxborovirus TaxID=2948710 RepID=A0A385UEC0_9CAUD|nr:hypothetical protein KNT99_gp46 [Gordonia phage NatB6]YP_010098303.1 hypothetical protein KNU10_gp47 [Gordonia phage Foxboro]YP_010098394.1 hypothetical protein KNU11_gp46 [Gordonia phage KidneyBean]YP_010098934.1 hypothetical protein KNU15_gp46 [Gordonia phage Emianna]AYD84160.1 hypothetical protein SEA_JIFALL16_45 [Gordonia phage Jifall16]AYD84318.1 hypothetical protein SEA_KURT_46 [Gordonia phage Kurt]QZD98889.1 hypothetical protein SEA_TRACKER_46 [Gordonia phage Tracker]AXH50326.1 hyp
MPSTNADKLEIADYIASRVNKITPHSGDPGTTGANRIGTLEAALTWPAAAMNGAVARAVSNPAAVVIPANTTVSHYGVWNGSTFRRGYPMQNPITTGPSPVSVDLTAEVNYTA